MRRGGRTLARQILLMAVFEFCAHVRKFDARIRQQHQRMVKEVGAFANDLFFAAVFGGDDQFYRLFARLLAILSTPFSNRYEV